MKNTFTFLFVLCILLNGCSNEVVQPQEISVIPVPDMITFQKGQFAWNKQTSIVILENDDHLRQCAEYFQQILNESSPSPIEIRTGGTTDNAVVLTLDSKIEGNEAYILDINKKQISIKANSYKGVFYGIQTDRKSVV